MKRKLPWSVNVDSPKVMRDKVGQKLSRILGRRLPFELVLHIVNFIDVCYKCSSIVGTLADKDAYECTGCRTPSCKKCIRVCFDCEKNKCKRCVKKEYLLPHSLDYVLVCNACCLKSNCKMCNEQGAYNLNTRCIECHVRLCADCSETCCANDVVHCVKCIAGNCCDTTVCSECNVNNMCNDCAYCCTGCSKGVCGECYEMIEAYEDGIFCDECRDNY